MKPRGVSRGRGINSVVDLCMKQGVWGCAPKSYACMGCLDVAVQFSYENLIMRFRAHLLNF